MRVQSPEDVRQDVGRRLAEIRVRTGWTQEQAAEKLGLSLKYLQKLETRGVNLTIETMVALSNRYGVPVRELFRSPKQRVFRMGRPRTKARGG